MNKSQLIKFVIEPVLLDMECYGMDAVNMLIMIAAHESRHGYYLHQDPGPAVGIFQIEPATHDDMIAWLERDRPELLQKLFNWTSKVDPEMMAGNMYYATFMARCFFLRFPEALPATPEAMAAYAKKKWNTVEGKATPADYLKAFKEWS